MQSFFGFQFIDWCRIGTCKEVKVVHVCFSILHCTCECKPSASHHGCVFEALILQTDDFLNGCCVLYIYTIVTKNIAEALNLSD
jgi:hypothetical protein